MKKIIAIMLAACCLLSLAVCGAKEADYKLGLGVTLNNVAEGYSLLQALVSSVAVGLPIQLMAASILALVAF